MLAVAEPTLLSETAQAAEGDRDLTFGSDRPNIAVAGKRFKAWFMTPGVINYEDCKNGGQELLRKETIDAHLQTLMGAPLTMGHVPTNMTKEELVDREHGVVDKVGFDAEKGWHFCEGTVETDNARNCINDGYGISVGMRALEFGPSGMWLNNRYDREMTRIKFHHLALVEPGLKPRIDESEIRLNSTGKKPPMNIVKLIKRALGANGGSPSEQVSELRLDTKIDLGSGQSATLQEMLDHERNNHCHAVQADDYIEHDGVRYHCGTLVNHFKEKMGAGHHVERANATETPAEKAAREVSEAAAAVTTAKTALDSATADAERPNAADEVKSKVGPAKAAHDAALAKASQATDRFNSLKATNADEAKRAKDEKEAAEKREREEADRQNAAKRAGIESFAILANASERGGKTVFISPKSGMEHKRALGRKFAGSSKN